MDEKSVATRLAKKLGMKQSPGKATMKTFAARVRELQGKGDPLDIAAMKVAKDMLPADFEPNRYAGQGDSIETILADIEAL